MTFAVERELKNILRKYFPKHSEEYFHIITTPSKPDLLYQELNDWKDVIINPTEKLLINLIIKD